jgi:hypothetical protein
MRKSGLQPVYFEPDGIISREAVFTQGEPQPAQELAQIDARGPVGRIRPQEAREPAPRAADAPPKRAPEGLRVDPR